MRWNKLVFGRSILSNVQGSSMYQTHSTFNKFELPHRGQIWSVNSCFCWCELSGLPQTIRDLKHLEIRMDHCQDGIHIRWTFESGRSQVSSESAVMNHKQPRTASPEPQRLNCEQ